MDKTELIEISEQIKSLEDKRKDLIVSVMKGVRKPITEWAATLPAEEFKEALRNLYVESHRHQHGRDYFTWGETKSIQSTFEWYVKMIMEGDCEEEGKLHENLVRYHKNFENDDKFFYYKGLNRFFNLKRFKSHCTTRSTHKTESHTINKDGKLVYSYSGTAYHGFGSVDDSVQQELIIDMEKMSVYSYTDSTDKYDPRSSGIHTINTDFIDGWIGFAKQVETFKKLNP